MIKENISPELEKLKQQRDDFRTWKQLENEINRQEKLLQELEYHRKKSALNNKTKEYDKVFQEGIEQKKNLEEITRNFNLNKDELDNIIRNDNHITDEDIKAQKQKLSEIKKKKNEIQNEFGLSEKTLNESQDLIQKLIRQIRENKFESQQLREETEFDRKQLQQFEIQLKEKNDQYAEIRTNISGLEKGSGNLEDARLNVKRQIEDNDLQIDVIIK